MRLVIPDVVRHLAVALTLIELAASQGSGNKTGPTINWTNCPPQVPDGIDCGSIEVPLSYKNGSTVAAASGNRTVTLALTRLNATGNDTQGALFFNPGGPGVSAAALVSFGKFIPNFSFSSNVTRRYDLIGLDPRGVGQSTPVQCDPDIFNERVTTYPRNASQYDELVDHNRRLGESCAKLSGPIINHLDSITVAKDHEVVRQALGNEKFNLLGMSYGSVLGSQYLELFPQRVGRMALDGLVDHSQSQVSTLLTEATTYETTLNVFFEWCDTNSTCALHNGTKSTNGTINSRKIFDNLLAKAEESPIPAPSCQGSCQPNVTAEDMRYNIQDFLEFYNLTFAPNWIQLGGALAEAANGNATALSTPLANKNSSQNTEGSPYAYLAIGCQDWVHDSRNVIDLDQRMDAVKPFAPQTLGASQTYYYQSTCIGWPAPLTNGQRPLNTRQTIKAPKVLLTHSVYDPSCSPVWADGLRQQLPTAISVTRNGTGHTSHFLVGGETRDAIDRFLATGDLPKDGTVYQT
jgi:pimeloyl-ACP methyl ester carboxylesterase